MDAGQYLVINRLYRLRPITGPLTKCSVFYTLHDQLMLLLGSRATLRAPFVLFVQCRAIEDGAVATRDKVVRQVCPVMERESAPAVGVVEGSLRIRLEGAAKSVQAIVVAGRTVDNVPRPSGVVQPVGVHVIVRHRRVTLVGVHVAMQDEVDIMLDQVRFENGLAVEADRAAVV